MPHLLDPLSPSTPPAVAAEITAGTTQRYPVGVVVLSVSPLVGARPVVAAAAASIAAGNRTIVTFPVGADHRVRAAVAALATRIGGDRLSIGTGAALADDPDAELAHVVTLSGEGSVPPADAFTTDFPVAEWNARVRDDAIDAADTAMEACGWSARSGR